MGKKQRNKRSIVDVAPTAPQAKSHVADDINILQLLNSTNHTHKIDACNALSSMFHRGQAGSVISSDIFPLLVKHSLDPMIKVGVSACRALRNICVEMGGDVTKLLVANKYLPQLLTMIEHIHHAFTRCLAGEPLKGNCYWHDTTFIELLRLASHAISLLTIMGETEIVIVEQFIAAQQQSSTCLTFFFTILTASASTVIPSDFPPTFIPFFTELQIDILRCLQVLTDENVEFVQIILSNPLVHEYFHQSPSHFIQKAQATWGAVRPDLSQPNHNSIEYHSDSIHTYQYISTVFSFNLQKELNKSKNRALGNLLQFPALPHSNLEILSLIQIIIANILGSLAHSYLEQSSSLLKDFRSQYGNNTNQQEFMIAYRHHQQTFLQSLPTFSAFQSLLQVFFTILEPTQQLDLPTEFGVMAEMLAKFESILRTVTQNDEQTIHQYLDRANASSVVNLNLDQPVPLSRQTTLPLSSDGLDDADETASHDADGDSEPLTTPQPSSLLDVPYDVMWNDVLGLHDRVLQQYRSTKHNTYRALNTVLGVLLDYETDYATADLSLHDNDHDGDDDIENPTDDNTQTPPGNGHSHPLVTILVNTIEPLLGNSTSLLQSILHHANTRYYSPDALSVLTGSLFPSPHLENGHGGSLDVSFYSAQCNPTSSSIASAVVAALDRLVTSPVISTRVQYFNNHLRMDSLELFASIIHVYSSFTTSQQLRDAFLHQCAGVHSSLLSLSSYTLIPSILALYGRYGNNILQQTVLNSQQFVQVIPSKIALPPELNVLQTTKDQHSAMTRIHQLYTDLVDDSNPFNKDTLADPTPSLRTQLTNEQQQVYAASYMILNSTSVDELTLLSQSFHLLSRAPVLMSFHQSLAKEPSKGVSPLTFLPSPRIEATSPATQYLANTQLWNQYGYFYSIATIPYHSLLPTIQPLYKQMITNILQYSYGLSLSPMASNDNILIGSMFMGLLSSFTTLKQAQLDAEIVYQLIMSIIDVYSEDDRFLDEYRTLTMTAKLKQFIRPYEEYYFGLQKQRSQLLKARKMKTTGTKKKSQMNQLSLVKDRKLIECEINLELTDEACSNLSGFVDHKRRMKL